LITTAAIGPMNETPASDLLRTAHRNMETHLDEMLASLKGVSAGRVADIRRDFLEIQRLALIHFDQEERVFYPAVRSRDPQVLAKMDEEHEVVRETERSLEEFLESISRTPTRRDLDELYRLGIEFHDAIQVHIIDEEDLLLKPADKVLSEAEQQRLAAAMLQIASGG
jgi:hemerythrin-like domain-containing protein